MSRLEAEIRAATRARADEITPDRIPPLDLAPTATIRPVRTGRRRRAAPVAAAAAVAVIAGVVAGLGASHGRSPAGHPATSGRTHHARRAEPGQLTARAAARLDNEVLGLFIPATGPQFTAGTQLEGAIQALTVTGTARCLARHGVTVTYPPEATMAARYAPNYADNSQFPDLALISRDHAFIPTEYLVGLRPAAGEGRAFHRWFSPCQKAAIAALAPLQTAGQQLNNRTWGNLMTRATTAPPVRATLGALRACATRYGWPSNPYGPPETAIRSFADFGDWVFGHLDGAGSRGAGAATMSRLERHWTGIFIRCGRPTLAAQDRWLAAQQVGFLRQHERQLRAVEALARQILRRAGAPMG